MHACMHTSIYSFFLWQVRNFRVSNNQVTVEYDLAKDTSLEMIYPKEDLYEL